MYDTLPTGITKDVITVDKSKCLESIDFAANYSLMDPIFRVVFTPKEGEECYFEYNHRYDLSHVTGSCKELQGITIRNLANFTIEIDVDYWLVTVYYSV